LGANLGPGNLSREKEKKVMIHWPWTEYDEEYDEGDEYPLYYYDEEYDEGDEEEDY
jgi:hypothetical protein